MTDTMTFERFSSKPLGISLGPVFPAPAAGSADAPFEHEIEQAWGRLAIAAALLLLDCALLPDDGWRKVAGPMTALACGFFVYALLLLQLVRHGGRPGSRPARARLIGATVLDQLAAGLAVHYAQDYGVMLLGLHFWALVGTGLRHPAAYAGLSGLVATLALWFNLAHPVQPLDAGLLVAGLIVALATTALYLDRVARRLHLVNQRYRQLATHDALTGLANRLLLQERLDAALARARRGQSSASLLLIDLNGFKQVNDQFGHLIGDRFLQCFARTLEAQLEAGDVAARLGGDEFAVLIERAPAEDDAAQMAERISAALAGLEQVDGCPIAVSAAIGTVNCVSAEFETTIFSPDEMIDLADKAMYRMKIEHYLGLAGDAAAEPHITLPLLRVR